MNCWIAPIRSTAAQLSAARGTAAKGPSWRQRLVLAAVLASLSTLVQGSTAGDPAVREPAPTNAPPIVTRQQVFTIPFTINPRETTPSEVQLYVSADGGSTWQFYQRQSPQAGGFHFRAARDGDYSFAVRTLLDGKDNQAPPANLPIELRVVVDTTLPELEFQAELGSGGELHARWTARDSQLAAVPIRVEYRTEASNWTNVAIPAPAGPPSDLLQGEVSWWVDSQRDGIVEVRAVVEDKAGNSRQVAQRVPLTKRLPVPSEATTGPATNQLVPTTNTTATGLPAPATVPSPADPTAQAIGSGPVDQDPLPPPFGLAPVPSQPSSQPSSEGNGTPSVVPSDQSAAQGTTALSREPERPTASAQPWQAHLAPVPPSSFGSDKGWTAAGSGARTASLPSQPADDSSVPDRTAVATNVPSETTGFSVHPPLADSYPTQRNDLQRIATNGDPRRVAHELPSAPSGDSTAGANPLRVSRSRTFELSYDLRHIPKGTVERVDLWSTPDQGATWNLYASDEDRVSPMQVQVQQEGIHGFRLVVQTRDGLSGSTPRPGDQPDIVVLTDWTRPVAEIVSVDFGQGARQGELLVRYVANDANLTPRPISLEYAPEPSGPWYTIAQNVENTGEYVWRIDASIPEQIVLRIQVDDRAGNRTIFPLAHPIQTSRLRPQAQILDVRPLDEAPGLNSNPVRPRVGRSQP